jgi:hypothetical protein
MNLLFQRVEGLLDFEVNVGHLLAAGDNFSPQLLSAKLFQPLANERSQHCAALSRHDSALELFDRVGGQCVGSFE